MCDQIVQRCKQSTHVNEYSQVAADLEPHTSFFLQSAGLEDDKTRTRSHLHRGHTYSSTVIGPSASSPLGINESRSALRCWACFALAMTADGIVATVYEHIHSRTSTPEKQMSAFMNDVRVTGSQPHRRKNST